VLSYFNMCQRFSGGSSPVLLGLLLAIPVSMLSSSMALGRQSRELGLFLTPEETEPPTVLRYLDETSCVDHRSGACRCCGIDRASRFVQALTDPYVNTRCICRCCRRRDPPEQASSALPGRFDSTTGGGGTRQPESRRRNAS
jgi:membrane glycosyltransferase